MRKLGLNRFLWFWVFSHHPETESWKFWHQLTTNVLNSQIPINIMGFPWKLPLDDCWIASNLPPETSLKHYKYILKLFSVIAKRLGHLIRVLHWFSWFRANHLLRLGMGPLIRTHLKTVRKYASWYQIKTIRAVTEALLRIDRNSKYNDNIRCFCPWVQCLLTINII